MNKNNNDPENDPLETDSPKRNPLFFTRKTGYYVVFLIVGILIGFLAKELFFETTVKEENPWVSNSEYIFGIDISHYQGNIDWDEVRTSHHPIEFVFIRSTMGADGKDTEYSSNWKKAQEKGYIRGAYHYYRPNENSTKQFNNYAASVQLISKDFAPILDIERPSKFGPDNLRAGVLNWLQLAEKKYGKKPVIYTGRTFYNRYLKGHVGGYPLWIASYSGKHKLKNIDWTFHQFTEKVRVKGIKTSVDGNDFKKELADLKAMCLD
jgi:GH25 family lysozyme M1 (1,4-beta-N-acetylmuramidase)